MLPVLKVPDSVLVDKKVVGALVFDVVAPDVVVASVVGKSTKEQTRN